MKRVLSVLLAAVLCVGMLTGCGEKKEGKEESKKAESAEKEESEENGLLSFGFTAQAYFEDFYNFGTFCNVEVDSLKSSGQSTSLFNAMTSQGASSQVTLLVNDDNNVANISINNINNEEFVNVARAAISATDMKLDFDGIEQKMNFGVPPASNEEARIEVSSGILIMFDTSHLTIQRDDETADEYQYIEIHSNPKADENPAENTIENNNESGRTQIQSLKFGQLLDVKYDGGVDGNTLVIKAKIEPSMTNKMTIDQNYFNVEDIILNKGGSSYNEIQYWAVADMTSGEESKVISFKLDKSLIDKIKNKEVAANRLEEYAIDLWVLPSLTE